MSAPNPNRRNALLLAALLFAQLLLMTGSVRGATGSSILETWLIRLTSPVVGAARAIGGAVHDAVHGVGNLLSTRERNVLLEAEIGRLRAELQETRVSKFENVRLRRLLEMRDREAGRWVGASVVTSVLTRQSKSIVIDRGEADGVRSEQPVVAWGGAVGRVVAVGPSHAKVRLLNDPNSGAAAVVQRSRAQGMVVGRGDAPLDLLYVPRFADVVHGDRVVTSGLDGIFPRGFGIGTVSSIEANADGSQTLRLEGELDHRSLEEVLVLLDPVGLRDSRSADEEAGP